jgi:uncharacterized membrane protein SpoIIM required for sporulation
MGKIILNLTDYQIAFIALWFVIALYTDWRMYKTNKHFLSKLDEEERKFYQKVQLSYSTQIIKNCVVITFPIILVITIIQYGLVVLSHKRSIHNGELLK